MSELYWLGVLGNLHYFSVTLSVLAVFAILAVGFWLLMCYDDGNEPSPSIKKVFMYSIFTFVFGTIMAIFIPSQKNLLIIYGVGGTIDYLKENKDANKIPDKCVKALDKYLDDALTEDKDKE